MQRRTLLRLFGVLVGLCIWNLGLALPIPAGAQRLGDFYTGATRVSASSFSFDSASGLMSYSANGGTISASAPSQPPPFGDRNGSFLWSATLDSTGNFLGPGAVSLALDLGSGLELLATGTVTGFGWRDGIDCFPQASPPVCFFQLPQVSMQMTYVDPRIDPYLGNFWLWTGSMVRVGPTSSLMSFSCGGSSSVSCDHFSGDQILGYRVPEPATLGLFVIMLGLSAFRHKRRLT